MGHPVSTHPCRRAAALATGVVVALTATAFARASPARLDVAVRGPDGQPVLDAVVSLHAIDPTTGDLLAPVTPPPDASAALGHAIMDQVDLAFAPHVLSIQAGTLVRFPNRDQVRHSIYSFSAPRVFEVKLYRGLDAPPIYFDRTGLVVLGCNIHDDMLAYVYVHDTPHSAVSDAGGHATIEELSAGAYLLRLRHPRLDANPVVERRVDVVGSERIVLTLSDAPPPRPRRERDDELDGLFGARTP